MTSFLNVVIRSDASFKIGTGHVMRCLTLAGELTQRGALVRFLCRQDEGNLIRAIEDRGYNVLPLPAGIIDDAQDARECAELLNSGPVSDWTIVDQYTLGAHWERAMRPMTKWLMAIDDLADRRHDCDLLLDQNFFSDTATRYAALAPPPCRQLLGPQYALLRPEFRATRQRQRERDGSVRRIMVFFGGSDRTNETTKVLNAIKMTGARDIAVDVVIGVNNPHGATIENAAVSLRWASCYRQVKDMAALMEAADLYIGAAGGTTWERCCLGLPSLVITVAENQVRPVQELDQHGILLRIGRHDEVTSDKIAAALGKVFNNPALLQTYGRRSMDLVDGLGAARCAEIIAPTSDSHIKELSFPGQQHEE